LIFGESAGKAKYMMDRFHSLLSSVQSAGGSTANFLRALVAVGCGLFLMALTPGCETTGGRPPAADDAAPYAAPTIQIGDLIRVTFPGATNLNLIQPVRVDGMLSLGQAGEVKALDKTQKELEAEVLKIFSPDLIVKEVVLQVESSGFPVFVSGAVLRPGKVMVIRSVTVMEAIMEAGGFDPNKADLRKVQIIRQSNGVQKNFVLNLKESLDLATSKPFHLRPSDIVVVPERFVFF